MNSLSLHIDFSLPDVHLCWIRMDFCIKWRNDPVVGSIDIFRWYILEEYFMGDVRIHLLEGWLNS